MKNSNNCGCKRRWVTSGVAPTGHVDADDNRHFEDCSGNAAQPSAVPPVETGDHRNVNWIVFQVGHDQKSGYRFILVPQGQEVRLREGEWIDTTTDAQGLLGGNVEVQHAASPLT